MRPVLVSRRGKPVRLTLRPAACACAAGLSARSLRASLNSRGLHSSHEQKRARGNHLERRGEHLHLRALSRAVEPLKENEQPPAASDAVLVPPGPLLPQPLSAGKLQLRAEEGDGRLGQGPDALLQGGTLARQRVLALLGDQRRELAVQLTQEARRPRLGAVQRAPPRCSARDGGGRRARPRVPAARAAQGAHGRRAARARKRGAQASEGRAARLLRQGAAQ
jgi:hypothetical protein